MKVHWLLAIVAFAPLITGCGGDGGDALRSRVEAAETKLAMLTPAPGGQVVGAFVECDIVGYNESPGVRTFRGDLCAEFSPGDTVGADMAVSDKRLVVTVLAADGSGTFTVAVPAPFAVEIGDPWPPDISLVISAD